MPSARTSQDLARTFLLGLAACGAAALAGPAAASEVQFRYGEDRAPSTLNPAFGRTMVDTRLEELLFEGLFTYDRFLNPVPALAARAVISADRTRATVYLRQSFWHDGEPVTPADVVFTVRALKHAESRSPAPLDRGPHRRRPDRRARPAQIHVRVVRVCCDPGTGIDVQGASPAQAGRASAVDPR